MSISISAPDTRLRVAELPRLELDPSLSIAIIGSRGYPSSYGGFETLVRRLAPFLVEQGHRVTVYTRRNLGETILGSDPRVRTVRTRGIDRRTLSTLTFGATSAFHARSQQYDAALILNPANGYFLPILRNANIPTAVNVDGLEWQRAKWNGIGKRVFYEGAKQCGRHADEIIYDSEALRPHWSSAFGVTRGVFIPYGADLVLDEVPLGPVNQLGLSAGQYVLVVSRLVPENSLDLLIDASELLDRKVPIVIVGSGHRKDRVVRRLESLAAARENIGLLGHVTDQSLLTALWKHSGAYWHGHSVGGTNPALLQAMGAGAPTLALDTPFNSEVLRHADQLVAPNADALATQLSELLDSPTRQESFRQSQRARIQSSYGWDAVCHSYEEVLLDLARRGPQRSEPSPWNGQRVDIGPQIALS